jgi:hypothetical protein
MIMGGKGNRKTRNKPAPVPLYLSQIPHNQTMALTRATSVGNQWLTAWATARCLEANNGSQLRKCGKLLKSLFSTNNLLYCYHISKCSIQWKVLYNAVCIFHKHTTPYTLWKHCQGQRLFHVALLQTEAPHTGGNVSIGFSLLYLPCSTTQKAYESWQKYKFSPFSVRSFNLKPSSRKYNNRHAS